MRVIARACFEPHHGKNPAAGHFVQRPTETVDRAFSRPATEPSDAKRLARTQPSGQRVFVWWVLGSGLTRMFGLAPGSPGCPEIDLSALSGCPPDTYRSGGVTY